jgi:membrane protease YdiL (CAAX protease family)
MFIPALVALILNTIRYKSFKLVFSPINKKIKLKSLAFSIFYPLLFICFVALTLYLTGLAEFNVEKLEDLKKFPPLIILFVGFLLMFGEEYGWRGFLLKNLAESKGKISSAMIVGLVWALWHCPIIYGLAVNHNMDNPILLTLVQMCAVFAFSIPFAHSFFLTNNIVPPMIFHFIWNYYNPLILGNIYRNKPGIMEGNLFLINGEGIAGVVFGMLFLLWYIHRYKNNVAYKFE